MSTFNIEFIPSKSDPRTLKPFWLFKQFQTPLDDFYKSESEKFGFYNVTVVSEDGMYLTNDIGIKAAMANHATEIDVIIAKGLTARNYLRFVSLGAMYELLCMEDRKELIDTLTDYIRNQPEGIAWGNEVGGSDINEKLGRILGYHKETIKYAKRVAKAANNPSDELDAAPNNGTESKDQTPPKTFSFIGKRYQPVGEPAEDGNQKVYSYENDDSVITISVRQKTFVEIQQSKGKLAKKLKVNSNFNPLFKEKVHNHKRYVDNLLVEMLNRTEFKNHEPIFKYVTKQETHSIIEFKWGGFNCEYKIMDRANDIVISAVTGKETADGWEQIQLKPKKLKQFEELIMSLNPIKVDELQLRQEEALTVRRVEQANSVASADKQDEQDKIIAECFQNATTFLLPTNS